MTAKELRTMYVSYFRERGHVEIASASLLPENDPTVLFTTAGMHPLVLERGYQVDMDGFRQKFEEHQAKSRQGAANKFAGGLADHSEQSARLHTATHLLHGALRKVLGEEVYQRGSNITSERLRFDFSFGRKMTKEELEQVSAIVNEAISKKIDVILEEMTPEAAYEAGAVGVFGSKYGEIVKVYTIPGYSKEICGGPHAKNTGDLLSFQIVKEEASSAGVRRIKAVIGKLLGSYRNKALSKRAIFINKRTNSGIVILRSFGIISA